MTLATISIISAKNPNTAHRIFGVKCIKNCPHYWFLDTDFAVSFWVKIDDVVTAMVVPAVHKHGVQDVVGWVLGVWLLKELIQG